MFTNNDKSLILNKIKSYYQFKSNAEFARFLDIKPQVLANWYARNTLDYDLIYTKCLGIDANFLLSGKGDIFLRETEYLNTMQEESIPYNQKNEVEALKETINAQKTTIEALQEIIKLKDKRKSDIDSPTRTLSS
jgi:hypothetical protein